MSLRFKILLLVSGAIVVPIAVFLISFGLGTDVESLRSYRALVEAHRLWRREFRDAPVDLEAIDEILEGVPVASEVRLFSGSGELLYRRPPVGLDYLRGGFSLSESVPVSFSSGGSGVIVVTRRASPLFRYEERWYVPLTGLLFVTAMVIMISYSVNRSIGNLEKATRRIAEGDLDFVLPIKGRDKLASLTRSFDSMREHLREESARRARFIMGISHDLKTPLASISGYANAIGEGYADTPEKLYRYIAIIEDKTKLLESRISMLIDYVRRETSDWKLDLEPVDLGAFFRGIVRMFDAEVALANRLFSSRLELPEGVSAPMDEEMMVRAMENLMKNAVAYSTEGSEIRFRCVRESGRVVVSLENEGAGIDPADLPHIFDPFVRGTPNRKGVGMGLGLSTVESVISSHGWKIAVESVPGGSTRFTITIPIGGK